MENYDNLENKLIRSASEIRWILENYKSYTEDQLFQYYFRYLVLQEDLKNSHLALVDMQFNKNYPRDFKLKKIGELLQRVAEPLSVTYPHNNLELREFENFCHRTNQTKAGNIFIEFCRHRNVSF